jgi:hypothetical protein
MKPTNKLFLRALSCGLTVAAALPSRAEPTMPSSEAARRERATYIQAGAPYPDDAYPLRRSADEAIPGHSFVYGASLSYAYSWRSDEVFVEEGPYRDGIDFSSAYLEDPALLYFDLGVTAPRGFSVEASGELRREWKGDWFASDNYASGATGGNPLPFDNNVMPRGVLYWRGESTTAAFGRDKVHYGPALAGTLYPSERLPYLDALRLDTRLGPLSVNWYVATIQAREAWDDVDVAPGDGFGFETAHATGATPTIILNAMHRFSWDFGRFKLGVAGIQVVSRRNNYFQLTDLFPVISWHNADIRQNNMALMADASWVPVEGLAVSAVAGIDDFNAENVGVADSDVPTITAAVIGAEWFPPADGGFLSIGAEAGYTHYLWGNFDGSATNKGDANPLSRAVFRYLRDGGTVLLPLTSPYGPGALWFSASAEFYPASEGFGYGAELTVLSKNNSANLINTSYAESSSVENASRTLLVRLRPTVEYSRSLYLLSLSPAVAVQDGEWRFEFAALASARFSGSRKVSKK